MRVNPPPDYAAVTHRDSCFDLEMHSKRQFGLLLLGAEREIPRITCFKPVRFGLIMEALASLAGRGCFKVCFIIPPVLVCLLNCLPLR